MPSKYTSLSGSGQVPLQCKPFFSVTYLPLCPFQQHLVTDPLGLDLLWDFLRGERFVHFFCPVPNSIIAFSYVNIAMMDQDRSKWTLLPCISPVYKAIIPGCTLAPVTPFKTVSFWCPLPFSLGPLLEEYVCFYFVCMCAPPSPKVLTEGEIF